MAANISERRDNLNSIIMLIVVFFVVNISSRIPNFESNIFIQAVTLLTSKGVYELLIKLLYLLIDSNQITLGLYWGDTYLAGFWSYEYTMDNKKYFGVWDIRQDLNETTLIGNGLDEDFRVRTIVRSVSPLLYEAGGFFFINIRNELNNKNAQVFSKTTLLLDAKKGLFSPTTSMRGITVVYGGPSDNHLHPNVVFKKHEDVSSIEQLIEKIKNDGSYRRK